MRDVELLLLKLRAEVDRDTFEAAVLQHEEDEERRAEERKLKREADANKKRADAARDNNNAAPAPATLRCTKCKKDKARGCFRKAWYDHGSKTKRNQFAVCIECEVTPCVIPQ